MTNEYEYIEQKEKIVIWIAIKEAMGPPTRDLFLHLELREDGPNGKKIDGEVKLFLQKEDDNNSRLPSFGWVETQAGEWQGNAPNLTDKFRAGYNTLVLECAGQKPAFYKLFKQTRTSAPPTSKNMSVATPISRPTTKAQPSYEDCKIKFTPSQAINLVDPDGKLISYKIPTEVFVFRGKKSAERVPVVLERQGEDGYYKTEPCCAADPLYTDGNGKVLYTFTDIKPGGPFGDDHIRLRASIQKMDISHDARVSVAKSPEGPKETVTAAASKPLVVEPEQNPVRPSGGHNYPANLFVKDKAGKGIPNREIKIAAGGGVIQVLDEDGNNVLADDTGKTEGARFSVRTNANGNRSLEIRFQGITRTVKYTDVITLATASKTYLFS